MRSRSGSTASFKDNRVVDDLWILFQLRNNGDKHDVPVPEPQRLKPTEVQKIEGYRTVQEEARTPAPVQQGSHRRMFGRKSVAPIRQAQPTKQVPVYTKIHVPRALGTYIDSVKAYIPFTLKGYTSSSNRGNEDYDSEYVAFSNGLLDFFGEDLKSRLFPITQYWSESISIVDSNNMIDIPGLKQPWQAGSWPPVNHKTRQPSRRGSMEKDMVIERTTSISSVRSSASSINLFRRRGSVQDMQQVQYHVQVGKAAQEFKQSWSKTGYPYSAEKSGYNCVIPCTFSARKATGEPLGFSPEALKRVKITAIGHMLRTCEAIKMHARSATISGKCVYELDTEGCDWKEVPKVKKS